MPEYEKIHWTLFNVLGRIVGAVFVIVGCIIAITGLFQKDGLAGAAGLIAAILGALVLMARRYRPDLGDSAFSKRKASPVEKREFP